ncbi:hypothetical protein FPOAC2_01319 [Fusarium poae]|jgi:hypothetical protein
MDVHKRLCDGGSSPQFDNLSACTWHSATYLFYSESCHLYSLGSTICNQVVVPLQDGVRIAVPAPARIRTPSVDASTGEESCRGHVTQQMVAHRSYSTRAYFTFV